MARQRIIFPEYWLDAELAQCDYVVRLFYIGTWNFSDDYGVIEDNLPKLRAQIFPFDLSMDILPIRDRLVALKKLIPFETEGKKWLFIKNFPRYQTINHPSKWQNPQPSKEILKEHSRSTPVALLEHSRLINISEVKRSNIHAVSAETTCSPFWKEPNKQIIGYKLNPLSFDDEYTQVIDINSGQTSVPANGPKINGSTVMWQLIHWAEKRRGKIFANRKKQMKAISMLKKAKREPREIQEKWLDMENSKFWNENGFDFMNIMNELDKKL